MNKNWYQLNQNEIFKLLNTSKNGLSDDDVKKRLNKYGLNELTSDKKQNYFLNYLKQFASPLIYLLIAVMIFTIILREYVDTFVILLIVLINATIGFYQELKAENSLKALKKIISLKTRVIRNDNEEIIDSKKIVIGDIIKFEQGDKISADLRIIELDNLTIDESIITGESIPAIKILHSISKKNANIIERKNIAYAGSIVSTGKGIGIAIATGNDTEIGKIAKEISEIKKDITPLHKNINIFAQYLLVATILICGLFFLIGIIKGNSLVDMFLSASTAAVSLIPEGLPAIITISLAIGVSKMAKKKAIVRELSAVETLGTINVIASDKTGTITYNQMTLEKIVTPKKEIIFVSGRGYNPNGIFTKDLIKIKPNQINNLGKILDTAILCNDSALINKADKWDIVGDPTEGSLLVAGKKTKIEKNELNHEYPRISEISFDSKIKYMATLNNYGDKNIIHVKGMLEKILDFSSHYYDNGKIQKLDQNKKNEILHFANIESLKAMRILGFAYKIESKDKRRISKQDVNKLIYTGFCELSDPPRPEVKDAIQQCLLGGIRPIMITGDYEGTALAIAKKIGIIKTGYYEVLSEEKLHKMTSDNFSEAVKSHSVFARITPRMKYKIVAELQKQNQIVAVTGDGVNDAPVLEKANIGIAMGIGGTDVAREASEIILLNNKFSTIVKAIEEGRSIFHNIRRAIFYLLSTNFGEIIILISSLLLGWNIPLLPLQILWINFITDSFSAISLVLEPKKKNTLSNPPREINEGILKKQNYQTIVLVAVTMAIGTLFLYTKSIGNGDSLEKSRSVAFAVMSFYQIFNMFNARSMTKSIFKLNFFSNKFLIFSFLFMSIATILTIQSSLFQKIFSTVGLSISEWIWIILVALSVIIVVELDKFIKKLLKS